MNKKKLSVVMAGAMLASSVAPVLAAETSELDSSQLGSLVEKVHEKLTSKVFDKNDLAANNLANESVYYVKINGEEVKKANGSGFIKDMPLTTDEEKEALRIELQEAFKGLTAGDKVEIYSHGFREDKDGKIFSTEEAAVPKYKLNTAAERAAVQAEIVKTFGDLNLANSPVDTSLGAKFDATKDNELKITFAQNLDLDNSKMPGYLIEDTFKLNQLGDTLVLRSGDDKLDFTKYYTATGEEKLTNNDQVARSVIKGFVKADKVAGSDITPDTLEETIKITGVQHNYKTEELYDGLMLTTEGHDLLSLVKEVRRDKGTEAANTTAVIKNLYGYTYDINKNITDLAEKDGEYGFVLVVKDAFGKTTEYTVKGAKKQTNILASWLNTELAKVDILAGENRYETAVEIAKEQAHVTRLENSDTISNIVLVNGNSLVDGLSASALAASITTGKGSNAAAPILLTEADKLPKATKAYLKELLDQKIIGNVNTTIHLVGGKAVLTRELEKELEGYGFKVERYGGDNREETSLKVAKKVNPTLSTGAFVVGANGEADAMSIAGVSAATQTPIIVSKNGGLSTDAIDELTNKKVTVIGGEAAVSEEVYSELKEEASAIRRIAGSDRQATNAAIIKEFYHNTGVNTAKSVIVAKDGKGNKGELIDALTAANLAAQTNAPVVLAKGSLTDAQIDALRLRAQKADSLYQVGIGVERPVVETIASKLGLLNK